MIKLFSLNISSQGYSILFIKGIRAIHSFCLRFTSLMTKNKSLMVAILRLNRLLITLVHHFRTHIEKIESRLNPPEYL